MRSKQGNQNRVIKKQLSQERDMKKIFIGLAVLVIVLGVVLWRVYANLDVIVGNLIEEAGSEVTQTSVKVSGVELDVLAGKAGLSELSVANPAGFSDPQVFSLEKVAVEIDIESLGSNPVIINEILVRQPKVFYEMNKDGKSNLDVLKKNVESYSASGSSAADTKEAQPSGSKGEEIKLIIKKLAFEGGHLVASSVLTPDKKIEADLPAFNMSNIGRSTGGATSDQIAKEVINELVRQAADAAARAGVDKLTDDLKAKGQEKLDEELGGALKGLMGK
jgi:hypothetical protein